MVTLRHFRNAIYAGVGVVSLLLVLSFVATRRTEQRQRLEIPREWARLAPYPESATDLRASTSGGMFSRAFRVSFSAPAADIERWLQESPGTREATPDSPSPGKRHYAISPGGGA
jgi:hypothetical protein